MKQDKSRHVHEKENQEIKENSKLNFDFTLNWIHVDFSIEKEVYEINENLNLNYMVFT